MPVRFGHVPRPLARQVLQYAIDAPLFVVVGTDRSFDRETALHWIPGQSRAVPCTHEDCPWCPLPKRYAVYLPVLAFTHVGRCWKEKVLPVTEGMGAFVEEPREKIIWELCRRRYKNAPVSWKRYEAENYRQPFAGFDVEESLWKIWGMFKNAKRTANRPGEDGPRLFEDQGELPAAG